MARFGWLSLGMLGLGIPAPATAQDFDGGMMSSYGASVSGEYESIARARRKGVSVLRGREAERYFATRRYRDARLRARRYAAAREAARRAAARR